MKKMKKMRKVMMTIDEIDILQMSHHSELVLHFDLNVLLTTDFRCFGCCSIDTKFEISWIA